MTRLSGKVESSDQTTRRQVLLGGGAALVGLTLRGDALAGLLTLGQATSLPGVTTIAGAKKPVFVPAAGSTDPVAHSLAESLFWLNKLEQFNGNFVQAEMVRAFIVSIEYTRRFGV